MSDETETDFDVGQNYITTNIGPFGLDTYNPVFLISGIAIFTFVIGTFMVPEQATGIIKAMQSAFSPLIAKVAWGWFGHMVDVVAVLLLMCLSIWKALSAEHKRYDELAIPP